MKEKKEFIIKLVGRGYTYKRIGEILGVSKQRIHAVLKNYSSPSHNTIPATSIPIGWIPKNKVSTNGIVLQGRDFLREAVRKRDNYTCQICGKIWKEGKRRFDVHHMDRSKEGRVGNKYENNKELEKMITLCHKCHLNLDHLKSGNKNMISKNKRKTVKVDKVDYEKKRRDRERLKKIKSHLKPINKIIDQIQ